MPRIHLTAVGSSATDMIKGLGVRGIPGLIALAQGGAGERFRVTASEPMILAREADEQGGRLDDDARVREVETLLGDDGVAAVVTLRGGAWFVRICERIRWERLERRTRRLWLFGFSEMTPLVAIAGRYPQAVGVYDLGPTFLLPGMRRWARKHLAELTDPKAMSPDKQDGFAAGWAQAQYATKFAEFFSEVSAILSGGSCPRVPTGRLVSGRLPGRSRIRITGGNLSLISALMGSRHWQAFDPGGGWLALEDLNEHLDQMDRMLAGLQHRGLFARAGGLLVGDFHDGDTEQQEAMIRIIRRHLPGRKNIPIVALNNFGHLWPIAPLPLHREVELIRGKRGSDVHIHIPWADWR